MSGDPHAIPGAPHASLEQVRNPKFGTNEVISDYFLNEDSTGKVHAEGDHKIHVARVTESDLVLDPRFKLAFNTAFETGPARPHGVAIE